MQVRTKSASGWKNNIGYIICWYSLSTLLSIYNKTLMGRSDMNLPLFMSAIHSGTHALISRFLIRKYNQRVQQYSTVDYITKVVPCGIAAAIEICCANASLAYITLSFYTMIKSSTPVWVLLFSSLFGFERPNFRVVGVISVIVFGVLLTIDGEPQFNIHGFSLVLIAAVASGLRWNMTQLLMKDMKEEKINQSSKNERTEQSPLSTMYHLSPVMFSTMILLSFYLENPFQKQQQIMKAHTLIYEVVYVLLAMSVGGILAFIMTLSELYLIKGTSTVTLSVAGISKEILVISLSVLLYGDVLTFKTYIGLAVSIIGILGYNYYKHLELPYHYKSP